MFMQGLVATAWNLKLERKCLGQVDQYTNHQYVTD